MEFQQDNHRIYETWSRGGRPEGEVPIYSSDVYYCKRDRKTLDQCCQEAARQGKTYLLDTDGLIYRLPADCDSSPVGCYDEIEEAT